MKKVINAIEWVLAYGLATLIILIGIVAVSSLESIIELLF